MTGFRIWLMAARPRTLPAAVAPVLVGTALAGFAHVFHPLRFVAALLSAEAMAHFIDETSPVSIVDGTTRHLLMPMRV